MFLGNLTVFGFSAVEFVKTSSSIAMLAEVGVILLLFQVGLESTVPQMLKVGLSSFLVATLGVVGPFVLGWGAGTLLLPQESVYAHVFLGATLTATSVGITARVLKDLGVSESKEARVILGPPSPKGVATFDSSRRCSSATSPCSAGRWRHAQPKAATFMVRAR